MPLYEYICVCGHTTDEFSLFENKKKTLKCEKCGKRARSKFSAPVVVAHYPYGDARVGRGRRDRGRKKKR